MSDASAEAERLTAALRARGYEMVDVPLGLLVGRVAVQRPSLILCDIDADGALETMHRLRDIPGGARVDIIFLGEAGRTLEDMADAVFHEGSGFFVRPVDVYALLHKVEALIGPPSARTLGNSIIPPSHRAPVRISSSQPPQRTSRSDPPGSEGRAPSSPPLPALPASHRTPSSPPSARTPSSPPSQRSPSAPPERSSSVPPSRSPSQPPSARRPSAPPPNDRPPSLPPAVPLGFGNVRDAGRAVLARQIPQSEMSPELEMLLARAEQRVKGAPVSAAQLSHRLAPDAEVEAVLPADVLAALDEPLDLDEEEDDDGPGSAGTRSGSEAGRTGSGGTSGGTAGGTAGGATALGSLRGGGTQATGVTGQQQVTGAGSLPPSQLSSISAPNLPLVSSAAAPLQPTTPPPRGAFGLASSSLVNEALRGGEALRSDEGPRGDEGLRGDDAVRPETEPPPTPPAVPTRPPSSPDWIPEPDDRDEAFRAHAPLAPGAQLGPASQRELQGPDTRAQPADPAQGRSEPSTTPPRARNDMPVRASTNEPRRPLEPSSPPSFEVPASLGRGDALRGLARAIRSRYTGALSFEDDTGMRRVLFRDGDFVTAASGIDAESLVGFLTQRGDLSPDAASLARKLPQFGRHAGAALIAHGHLRQDDLWPVLRAHAEWILGRIVAIGRGGASIEKQVPPRLQAEPAVFGGATGAEVLVEIARRTLPADEALSRIGGPSAQLMPGPGATLLRECALADPEVALVEEARGARVVDVIARAGVPEFASVLYALVELAVLEATPGPRIAEMKPQRMDELDENALRSRILARASLVQEGDYFALLGVARGATSYDIRRAYLELRREFEPSRVMTARTADLRDEVDTILEVLDEAYEILRDDRRRDRYRRALDAAPR